MAAPYPQWYDATDSSVISATISSTQNAGTTLAAVNYHVWNDKGGSVGSTTLQNARLIAEGFDGTNWVRSGLPCLDEGWLQVQLTGQNTTGDSTMEAQTSAYTSLGTNRFVTIKNIPKNCARYVNAKIVVPAGAANAGNDMRLVLVYDEANASLGRLTSLFCGGGILPDWFDASNSRITRGRTLSASGTDVVTVAKGSWTNNGIPCTRISDSLTLNQTAADGALSAGQSYIAVISQPPLLSAGVTSAAVATKGNRATSPTAPATPSGNIFLGKVTVAYQGGGTSIINTANIDSTSVTSGEFNPVAASSGLTINVGAGSAISGVDTEITMTSTSAVTVVATDSHLWLNSDGTFQTSTAYDVPPSSGSVLIASYSNDGVNVTGVTDLRNYVGHETHTMTLRYYGPSATSGVGDWAFLPRGTWAVERYAVVAASVTSGTDVKVDILSNFSSLSLVTIFKNSGTSDLRPVIGQSLGDYFEIGSDHEETIVSSVGTLRYQFNFISGTDGGATDVQVQIYFRRIR